MYLLKNNFLLLLLPVFLEGCAGEKEHAATAKVEESFALEIADTIVFNDGGQQFWLSLQDIQDNRCPRDVNCITAGKANIQLAIEQQQQILILCSGADCVGENQNNFLIRFNNRSYNIVLENVVPYPEEGTQVVPKQAILKIKRATG